MAEDYSEYVLGEEEKYNLLRRNTPYLRLDYFSNTLSFSQKKNVMRITVDGGKEYVAMFDAIQEEEKIAQEQAHAQNQNVIAADEPAEDESMRKKELQENANDLAAFQKRFSIDRTKFKERSDSFYQSHPEEKEEPLINVLSGAEITLPVGEGILDFIDADFEEAFKEARGFITFFWKLLPEEIHAILTQRRNDTQQKEKHLLEPDADELYLVKKKTQTDVKKYFQYAMSMSFVKDLAFRSLYTAICPPVLSDDKKILHGLYNYYAYLRSLQEEYLSLLEFCFDENYHPEILGRLKPEDRYALFRQIRHLPPPMFRRERISFQSDAVTETQIYDKGAVHAFAEEFDFPEDNLREILRTPVQMIREYEFHRVSDILSMEFSRMLETGVRMRKCKRCGKYFLMKGYYDTQYCSRIAPGETRKCQELAAQENYKRKAENNPALDIYSKYYRRYSARVKVNQIKPDAFRKWKYAAISKRNDCVDGKISVQELTDWMEAYFPNRQKKQ